MFTFTPHFILKCIVIQIKAPLFWYDENNYFDSENHLFLGGIHCSNLWCILPASSLSQYANAFKSREVVQTWRNTYVESSEQVHGVGL